MNGFGRSGFRRPHALLSLFLVSLGLALFTIPLLLRAAAPSHGIALALTLEGAVGPASADYLVKGLARARERDVGAVILSIDTPGGLDISMRQIIRAILASPVPVLAWVGPSGARAASAGTYILYASHIAAMAPGTNLGAATPVQIGGGGAPAPSPAGDNDREQGDLDRQGDRSAQDNPAQSKDGSAGTSGATGTSRSADKTGSTDKSAPAATQPDAGKAPRDTAKRAKPATAMEAKVTNDAVAYIRSLAELRGRNADWAEAAVRDAESLSAHAALERKVIDIVAPSMENLLEQADGRTVMLDQKSVVLQTKGLTIERFDPDWRTRVLGVITDPNVALILMMIGIYGLIFEFMSPGALLPGTLGAISLLIGLYALAALPVNFTGVALIVLGTGLMIAEAFTPSFGTLGIGGVVAFIFGATIMMDTGTAPGFELSWSIIAGVAVASLLFALLVGRLALRSRHGKAKTGAEAMLGEKGEVMDWSGRSGHVFARSERWNAVSEVPLEVGRHVTVVGIEQLTLRVVPAQQDPLLTE